MTRLDLLDLLPRHSAGAELGVCDGDFSCEILARVHPSRLYLVDVWQHIDLGYPDGLMVNDNKQRARYHRVIKKFLDDHRVRIIRDYTRCLSEILPEHSLDWIYIDGDHSYRGCRADLEMSDRLVNEQGFICGHDYTAAEHYGVIEAVEEFVCKRGYFLSLLTDERARSYCITKDQQVHRWMQNQLCTAGSRDHG